LFEQVREFLVRCNRHELRDHAFGDREITWTIAKNKLTPSDLVLIGVQTPEALEVFVPSTELVVGFGYAGQGEATVGLEHSGPAFNDRLAFNLSKVGRLAHVERNDMQGADVPRYVGG
jgi:hypothetical protein